MVAGVGRLYWIARIILDTNPLCGLRCLIAPGD